MEMTHQPRWLVFIYIVLVFALFIGSCNSINTNPQEAKALNAIDPILREYYLELGGEKILGQPISDIISWKNYKCQYTVSSLLCFDENNTGQGRYFLAPISDEINFKTVEPIFSSLDIIGDSFPQNVYPPFQAVLNNMRQTYDIGNAISVTQYNITQERIEQYYERIGLFQPFDDEADVSLLPYGVLHCGPKCTYELDADEQYLSYARVIEAPFAPELSKYGGIPIFGKPLSEPYTADDDQIEQIFENVIAYKSSASETGLMLRPLPTMMDMITNPPGPKSLGVKDNVIFYITQEELGYHVPLVFDQFITDHGGMSLSGNPISEATVYEGESVARQCFEYYCLEYDQEAGKENNIRLTPLGLLFIDKVKADNNKIINTDQNTPVLNIQKEKNQVSSDESQKITITVQDSEQLAPVQDIATKIIVSMPGGEDKIYYPELTNADGKTSYIIPPSSDLENGTIVTYQVCINLELEEPVCKSDSYLIWSKP